jgi:hypothetical protein
MQKDATWKRIAHLCPNELQSVVLRTLIRLEHSSANELWIESGLLSRDVVRQTLEQLTKTKLIQTVIDPSNVCIFHSTLQGKIVSFAFTGDDSQVINVIMGVSPLYRDLAATFPVKLLAFNAACDFVLKCQEGGNPVFDEILEHTVSEFVDDCLFDWLWNGNTNCLDSVLSLSRTNCVRSAVSKHLDEQSEEIGKMVDRLKQFRERFETGAPIW